MQIMWVKCWSHNIITIISLYWHRCCYVLYYYQLILVGSDYAHPPLVFSSGHSPGHLLQHHTEVYRDTEAQIWLPSWSSSQNHLWPDAAFWGQGDCLQLWLYLTISGATGRHWQLRQSSECSCTHEVCTCVCIAYQLAMIADTQILQWVSLTPRCLS